MADSETRDLDLAIRRRTERIPARFGSHLAYCDAVEAGLLASEPKPAAVVRSFEELRRDVDAMMSEDMPPWTPRPAGPTCFSAIVLGGGWNDELDE